MKARFFTVLGIILMAAQVPAFAGDDDSEAKFGTRYSIGADKKIAKGFHVFADEEIRLYGVNAVDRLYTNVGTSYKVNDYLKLGLGYSAISVQREDLLGEMYWDWRHRATADITGMIKAADFKFSLKERFQATYKTRDINTYEQPKTAMALKSRFKVAYQRPGMTIEPYVFVEHRLCLNGAKWDENSTTEYYRNSSYIGNSDVYTSRIRAQLGFQWRLTKHSAIDAYALFDRVTDKIIEAKRTKGTLKLPIFSVDSNYGAAGIGYTFLF